VLLSARLARRLVAAVITLSILSAVLVTALAWRLAQGPLEVTWLAERVERMVNPPENPTRVSVGRIALGWDGFQAGIDSPLELRLTDIAVVDQAGRRRMAIPEAAVSLSLLPLLRLRLVPSAIEIDRPRLTLVRATDGTVSLDVGTLAEATEGMGENADPSPAARASLAEVLRELAQPMPVADAASGFSRARMVRVRDAAISVIDHRAQTTWTVPQATIDLERRQEGGVDASATLTVALGGSRSTVTASGVLLPGDGGARVSVRLDKLSPAVLARTLPALAPLAAVDAPLELSAEVALDGALRPQSGTLRATVGRGLLRVGEDTVALAGATLALALREDTAMIESGRVVVTAQPDRMPTVLTVSGRFQRTAEAITGSVTAGFDQALFADLPLLWPKAVAPRPRAWIVENIPSGRASNAEIRVDLAVLPDFSDLAVTGLSGGLNGEDLTVHWLRPVPPLEQGRVRMNFLDADSLEFLIAGARQRGGSRGTLNASGGRMVIGGLNAKDQIATIDADVTGPVAAVIGLLQEPRLAILSRQKIEFRDPAGDTTVRLTVKFPLEDALTVDGVAIKANVRLTRLHLTGLVAGRDIDQGEVELEATSTGMTLKGRAQLAAIPVQIDGVMDFREGPPTQVVRRITANGRATATQLAAAGLDPEDWLTGEVTAKAVWAERRNGTGDVAVEADLSRAVLTVPPVHWRKPAGTPARGSARIVLANEQMRMIDRVTIDGDGISFRGTMDCAGNRIAAIRIDSAVFGRSSVNGSVRFPDSQPIAVRLSGATLDLEPKLRAKTSPADKPNAEPPAGPAWQLDSQFDRVLLAHGRVASNVIGSARFDGRIFSALSVGGRLGAEQGFRMTITGPPGQRRFALTADDAGGFLQGMDVIKSMEGGVLSVTGTFDDRRPNHPLSGSARITDFRVRGSVGLAKLLQAMTLYGLVDVLRGPGLGFTELIAPFRMDAVEVTLDNARAFSASLGLTAKGQLLPHDDRIDVEGTIVPAYFFNSLLGNIPLVGRLFSPETGGGVFAARYTVRGALDDPTVFVNPLSALTPGFLREIFGIF
jgi:hypothetical protein